MDQPDRPMALVHGAQDGQHDRVVAAHRDRDQTLLEQRVEMRLDPFDGIGDVVGIGSDVAEVVDSQTVERGGARGHVVRPDQHALGADASRSEACSRPVRRADVEWHTDDADVELLRGAASGQAHERGDPGETGQVVAAEWLWERWRRHRRTVSRGQYGLFTTTYVS